ncbi:class C sortase [Bifidobacterium callimiconis]|uniref:Sortase n=1 Tax=Bifidobacterium callimiconis TaxID=2306973 RepID=A0A430F802_9BIFI|nr:class C sortase [Bifidobacterium callimiconis]RSX48972.1 sortase [Bifidobacterium callimiconis]
MKKLRDILPILVILGGLLVLFYPTISNLLIMHNASRVVSHYDSAVNAMSDEEYQKIMDAAHAYNSKLAQESAGDPTGALANAVNTDASDSEYMSLLNVNGDGMMGYITVPRLHETLPIYHGTAEKVLQVGIGHLEGTSLPVGGSSTHAALSGHRGLPSAKLFTDLNRVKTGDRFYIKILKDTYAYEVDRITTVLPTDTQELAIEDGKDQVTLITCTPYGVNSHRLLVRGHRVPYTPDMDADAAKQFGLHIPAQYIVPLIGLAVLLIGVGVGHHIHQRRYAVAAHHSDGRTAGRSGRGGRSGGRSRDGNSHDGDNHDGGNRDGGAAMVAATGADTAETMQNEREGRNGNRDGGNERRPRHGRHS